MSIETSFGSVQNGRDLLDLLGVIEERQFELLEASRGRRLDPHTAYHVDRTVTGADYFYYDPFTSRKISLAPANSRVRATWIVPDGMSDCWDHFGDEWHWVLHGSSYEYTGVVSGVDGVPVVPIVT